MPPSGRERRAFRTTFPAAALWAGAAAAAPSSTTTCTCLPGRRRRISAAAGRHRRCTLRQPGDTAAKRPGATTRWHPRFRDIPKAGGRRSWGDHRRRCRPTLRGSLSRWGGTARRRGTREPRPAVAPAPAPARGITGSWVTVWSRPWGTHPPRRRGSRGGRSITPRTRGVLGRCRRWKREERAGGRRRRWSRRGEGRGSRLQGVGLATRSLW